ncbi:MAG: DUF6515 family protein [Rikenellaceae bacterium]
MKRTVLLILSLLFMVVASSEFTYAKSSKQPSQSKPQTTQSYKGKPVTVVKSSKPKSVAKLPATKYPIKHNGVEYYRSGSKFYKNVNGRFVLTVLPFGLRVPIIPAVHTIFRFNNINYYSSEGVIYQEAGNNEYVVVEPQVGMVVPELPMVNVSEVSIDNMIYFEFDGILYKQIPTVSGLQYEVVGTLSR